MRYYIASGLANVEQVKRVKAKLDAAGWEHTYDWTVHGSVRRDGIGRLAEVAAAEIEGVYMADVVIVLLPGGRGTHTELGAALSMADCYIREAEEKQEPRIVVYSPDPERDFAGSESTCAFYYHPCVERFGGDLDGVIDALVTGVMS